MIILQSWVNPFSQWNTIQRILRNFEIVWMRRILIHSLIRPLSLSMEKQYWTTERINTKLATYNVVPTEAFAKVLESYDALRRPQSRLIPIPTEAILVCRKHVANLSEHTRDQK
jgi:hypothetical protein